MTERSASRLAETPSSQAASSTDASRLYAPDSLEALREIVAAAVSSEEPLAIEGSGSKRGLGRPVNTAATLSTAKLTGVTLYEPDELVLSAKAGTPIAEIEALVDENGQRLEFEPIDRFMAANAASERSAACSPAIFPALAASSRARRATMFLASPPFRAGRRSSSPAAGW